MTRPIAYIAGPFGDPSGVIRAHNVARAILLGRLAEACGYAAYVPHVGIAAGVHGDDAIPGERARGMESTEAILRGLLATPDAVLWALLRDDGSASDGVAAEMELAVASPRHWQGRTWDDVFGLPTWRDTCAQQAPHLLPEWDRLAMRPAATPAEAVTAFGAAADAALRAAGVIS